MAKFTRFDPRNKKNGRNKKMTLEGKPKKKGFSVKTFFEEENEKYMKKYKKFVEDEAY
tara:strand:- start:581 stop:754 length:174 start_codon:yes stop_codon:yes gene_type:complete